MAIIEGTINLHDFPPSETYYASIWLYKINNNNTYSTIAEVIKNTNADRVIHIINENLKEMPISFSEKIKPGKYHLSVLISCLTNCDGGAHYLYQTNLYPFSKPVNILRWKRNKIIIDENVPWPPKKDMTPEGIRKRMQIEENKYYVLVDLLNSSALAPMFIEEYRKMIIKEDDPYLKVLLAQLIYNTDKDAELVVPLLIDLIIKRSFCDDLDLMQMINKLASTIDPNSHIQFSQLKQMIDKNLELDYWNRKDNNG